MSHPQTLDELPQIVLEQELARREERRSDGLCDYCARPWTDQPPCKFPERHTGPRCACGQPVPSARGRGRRHCSTKCKNKHADMRRRARDKQNRRTR